MIQSQVRPQSRGGFTAIEILVVLVIIASVLGLGWPAVQALRQRQALQRTDAVLQLVVAAIANYRRTMIEIPAASGGTAGVRPLWDFNGDGLLDGDPTLDVHFTATERAIAEQAGYRGFLAHSGVTLPPLHIDAERRAVDAWRRPLRVVRGADIYGPSGWGVWSPGPDGLPDTTDDRTSWSAQP